MRTRLEVFQRLDSRLRGNDKQGGNDEGDAFLWSPYPKLGLHSMESTSANLHDLTPSAKLLHGAARQAPEASPSAWIRQLATGRILSGVVVIG